jgi:cysteine desulfurase
MEPIYLDYNATTPVDAEVAEVMKPFLSGFFGNPSSSHAYGYAAREALEKARSQVAALLGCQPDEIIFTSGGSESNNLAIRGLAAALRKKGNHIITSVIEHPAVTEVCRYLEKHDYKVSYMPVDHTGIVKMDELKKALRHETILITIMHANNETGTLQPIREISALARKKGIVFHTDAAQSIGKIPVRVHDLGVDMLSIAGHKFYAPKGIGALYVKRGIPLEKLILGADHEHNLRAGTENVMSIAGMGKACEVALRDLEKNARQMKQTRDMLEKGILDLSSRSAVNGHPEKRLPNTLNISFPGMEADHLLTRMEQVAASAGAACHSDKVTISHVLQAMNIPLDHARGSLRFSTGKYTTGEEVEEALDAIGKTLISLGYLHRPVGNEAQVMEGKIKLTHYTQGLGCACKMRPQALEKVLGQFSPSTNPSVLVDTSTADDASVYRISHDLAIVQTVDFFTPIVDSPYDFGAIAAANALSDIYAMGAKPLYALSIVGFPSDRLPLTVLQDILKGAREKCAEAGVEILGGHSIDDPEPKFGLIITGLVHPDRILRNSGAQPGDVLILTKPLGTGILSTAVKRGLLSPHEQEELTTIMSSLNDKAAAAMEKYPVSACTDVTGFGLLGHLLEMTRASGVDAELTAKHIPVIPGCPDLVARKIIPGGTRNNLEYVGPFVSWSTRVADYLKFILADAQTSGGLLISVPQPVAADLLADLLATGVKVAAPIGKIRGKGTGLIHVN